MKIRMSFNDVINNQTTESVSMFEETYTEIITVLSNIEIGIHKPENDTDLINRQPTLNSSNDDFGDYYEYTDPGDDTLYKVLSWCVYTTVFFTGCSGNLMVLFSISRCHQLKGVPAMSMVSLAVADFLCCLIIVPTEMYAFYATEFHLGPFACRFGTFIHHLVFATSSFTLTLISIERLYVVKYPLQARAVITKRRARFVLVGAWAIAALCAGPNTYRQQHVRYEWEIYRWAQCFPGDAQPWKRVNAAFDFLVKFTIPVTIMAVSYAITIVTLYKSGRQSKRLQNNIQMRGEKPVAKSVSTNVDVADLTKSVKQKAGKTKAERQQADRNQTILMLFVVVLLYFVSWGPFMTFQLLDRFDVIDAMYLGHLRLTYTLLKMLGIGNSCMNPFLYVFMSKSFRSAMKTALSCKRPGPQTATSANNIGRSAGGLNARTAANTSHTCV